MGGRGRQPPPRPPKKMEKWSSAQKTHIESSLTKAFAYSLTTAKDAESTLQIVKTFHWKGLIDISNVLHFFVFHGYRSCYRPLVDNPMPDCAKWESMPNVGSTYIDMNAFVDKLTLCVDVHLIGVFDCCRETYKGKGTENQLKKSMTQK